MKLNDRTRYFFSNDNEKHEINIDDLYDLIKLAKEENFYIKNYDNKIRPIVSGEKPIKNHLFQIIITSLNELELQLKPTPYGLGYIPFASNNHFFRGENKLYDKSVPSLNREIIGLTEKETELIRLINNMRIYHFYKFIQQFDIVKKFNNHFKIFNVDIVNIKTIAQHYGFKTHLLDITNDVMTALFFAVCYYDPNEKKYLPLAQEMIDKEYEKGIIFHAPRHMFNIPKHKFRNYDYNNKYSIDDKIFANDIFQIGFQPLFRCHYQKGYVMPMREDAPIQENEKFEKLVFKQSVEFSKKIYDMMYCGELIYPFEGISELENQIEHMKLATTFSNLDFESVYENEVDKTVFPQKEECLKNLKEYQNINIIDSEINYDIDSVTKNEIDQYYKLHESILDKVSVDLNYVLPN